MKGDLSNYAVDMIKEFFNVRLKQDINYIENNLLSKNIKEDTKKYLTIIIVECRAILKIDLSEESDKTALQSLMKDYEDGIALIRRKEGYDIADLKTTTNVVHKTFIEMQKLTYK